MSLVTGYRPLQNSVSGYRAKHECNESNEEGNRAVCIWCLGWFFREVRFEICHEIWVGKSGIKALLEDGMIYLRYEEENAAVR